MLKKNTEDLSLTFTIYYLIGSQSQKAFEFEYFRHFCSMYVHNVITSVLLNLVNIVLKFNICSIFYKAKISLTFFLFIVIFLYIDIAS
jgi:hypothetical protein